MQTQDVLACTSGFPPRGVPLKTLQKKNKKKKQNAGCRQCSSSSRARPDRLQRSIRRPVPGVGRVQRDADRVGRRRSDGCGDPNMEQMRTLDVAAAHLMPGTQMGRRDPRPRNTARFATRYATCCVMSGGEEPEAAAQHLAAAFVSDSAQALRMLYAACCMQTQGVGNARSAAERGRTACSAQSDAPCRAGSGSSGMLIVFFLYFFLRVSVEPHEGENH